MHTLYAVIAAFIIGAGLVYGFRGWIARTKAKEAAALQKSAQSAASALSSGIQGVAKKL